MSKKTWSVAKLNLKNINTPYFITASIFTVIFVQSIVYAVIAGVSGNAGHLLMISSGNYLWLLIIFAAIFIPIKNFRRIVNLGGKRGNYFWGSITTYAVLSGVVSIVNTVFFYIYERFLLGTGYFVGFSDFMQDTTLIDNHYITVNMVELFGWSTRGVFFVVIQQFAFLFLLAVVVHTLVSAQSKWYGWAADVLIVAVISVFTPINPLRQSLLWFFNLIIFHSNALAQITACMVLAILIYSLNKLILARKPI